MGAGQTYKPATGQDVDILARTLYGEARGEYLAGLTQVAYTILKRAALAAQYVAQHGKPHPHYGDGTILSACKSHRQFSCWNVGDKNYAEINKVGTNDHDFQVAMYVALGCIHGALPNKLPAATHYLNPEIVKPLPAWVTGVPPHDGQPAIPAAKREGSVGHHMFYSGVAA